MSALWEAGAQAQCRLCGEPQNGMTRDGHDERDGEIPLKIEITANLNFSRLALLNRSGGDVTIDPVSGSKQVRGGIADLGGLSLHGEGRLRGEPGRHVRIYLPERIQLTAPNGASAELERLETNLPAQAQLDRQGRLTFTFGGRLRVTGNTSGQFRGRIAITAEYE